jgi:hypothetical protein
MQLGNFHPFLQATKALRESRGIALICFWTSALEGSEGSASRPGRILPSEKARYPLHRRLGGPQGRSGQVRKISPPPGFYYLVAIYSLKQTRFNNFFNAGRTVHFGNENA